MPVRTSHFRNTIFIAACLAVGCTSGGNLGCGSSSEGAAGLSVDSNLLGIYNVDQYQVSEGGCDALADADPAPSRIVLYGVESEEVPTGAAIGGQFCGSVADCRRRVKDLPGVVNYSFLQGSDAAGWQGWGIATQGMAGDECLVEVQTHTLTSTGNQAIRIDTRQVETRYDSSEPEPETNTVTCSIRAAIEAIDEDSPCKKVFLLEATFEEDL